MKLHPVDIAKELKAYSFFQAFPDDLLIQIATIVETAQFPKDAVVLKEGDANSSLYFIRKGHAEVLLAGEVVALLQNKGEVIGEMSVVTGRPVSTTIRAAEDMDCFRVRTENFAHVPSSEKEHFLYLLYRIYSTILADRLVKTNEKARLFEIANRELHQAQMALDKAGPKNVLLVEFDKKQLALAKMALGSTGVHLDTSNDPEAAKTQLNDKAYDAIVADETCLGFLEYAREQNYPGKLVMMMTKDVSQNLAQMQRMGFIDHMMTREPEDRHFTIRTILTTLTKVLGKDIFGLEKYLTWGVDIQSRLVKASTEREPLREEMGAYFKKMGVRTTILDRVNMVSEELLMNAIYDAPTDSKGTSLFNHLSRRTEIVLESHLQSSLRYASDGVFLAVSVTDPFGSLTKDILLKYLDRCYQGRDELPEHAGKGGAGRGLHQIVENSDLTIFNVKKGVKTEVICLFYVEGHRRETRPSFHYFFI